MRNFMFVICMNVFLFTCCNNIENEGFRSKVLRSSKGEYLYINSVNYGMTSDHQMIIITKDRDRLKFENDTANIVFGLDPFLYTFDNDTLTLYFNQSISYKVKDNFSSIKVDYKIVSNSDFMNLIQVAIFDRKLFRVPDLDENINEYIPTQSD